MTISFDVMMSALEAQLAETHYVYKCRSFLQLDPNARVDIKVVLTNELKSYEFANTSDFVKKINSVVDASPINYKGRVRCSQELKMVREVLRHCCNAIESQEEKRRIQLRSAILVLMRLLAQTQQKRPHEVFCS